MKIKVFSKKVTITYEDGKSNTFYRYFMPCRIQVFENGEDKGIQEKNIEVHFTKSAMKKLPDDKVFGIFEIANHEDYSLPFTYEIKKNEKGELEYPQVWIRNWENFTPTPYTPKQNTCEPIIDEDDTEPVEIAG